jgi:hypothetical protein
MIAVVGVLVLVCGNLGVGCCVGVGSSQPRSGHYCRVWRQFPIPRLRRALAMAGVHGLSVVRKGAL